jgi:dTDP-4-dehydrorhamnose 3,5-epimerase
LEFKKLAIEGAWVAQSKIHRDERGSFREWYKESDFSQKIGTDFSVAQANMSVSSKGVLRGIHYSMAAKGQAKWITCSRGRIWDVVVDIRPDSKTYKQWIGIELSADSGTCLFLSGQLGHAFISLEDETVVNYLVDSEYNPSLEFDINPFDLELGIVWPEIEKILSAKDALAPDLAMREKNGTLPSRGII